MSDALTWTVAKLGLTFAGAAWRLEVREPPDGCAVLPSELTDGVWWIEVRNSGAPLPDAADPMPATDWHVARWISMRVGEPAKLPFVHDDVLAGAVAQLTWHCIASGDPFGVMCLTTTTWRVSSRLIVTVHSPRGLLSPRFETLANAWHAQRERLSLRLAPGDVLALRTSEDEVTALRAAGSPQAEYQAILDWHLRRAALELADVEGYIRDRQQGVEDVFHSRLGDIDDGPFDRDILMQTTLDIAGASRLVEDLENDLARRADPRPDGDLPLWLRDRCDLWRARRQSARDALAQLSRRLTASAAQVNGTGMLVQLMLMERQADAERRRAEQGERLQSLAATVASVFVVPSLIATVYSAQVALPARGSTDALLSLIALMVAGGLATSVLLARAGRAERVTRRHTQRLVATLLLVLLAIGLSAGRPIHALRAHPAPAKHSQSENAADRPAATASPAETAPDSI